MLSIIATIWSHSWLPIQLAIHRNENFKNRLYLEIYAIMNHWLFYSDVLLVFWAMREALTYADTTLLFIVVI